MASGQIVGGGSPSQPAGVFGRQAIGLAFGVVLNDTARHHGAQPLANVSLLEPGPFGNLVASAPVDLSHTIEQSGPVPDGDHHGQASRVDRGNHLLGELLFLFR